jgi:hypothetical protein
VKISRPLMLTFVLLLAGSATASAAHGRNYQHRPHGRVHSSIQLYWGPAWGWWDPWFYGPRWGYTTAYPNPTTGGFGALDLDVSPERAEVWVDGRKVGVADDFDGFPNYLWLEKGTYDVAFYLDGYRTLARQYTIYAGLVVDVEDRLEAGETIHPSDLGPKTHERRDARIRAEEQRERELERRRSYRSAEADEDEEVDVEDSEDGAAPELDADAPRDARSAPGRLRLEVLPEDASVYLDGRFLGTGRELAGLRAGLMVDPGEHRIEVVRPGHRSSTRTVEVGAGAELELDIELETE